VVSTAVLWFEYGKDLGPTTLSEVTEKLEEKEILNLIR
jgi:hypothetical protein